MSDLGAAFRDIIDAFLREVHTALPCSVVSYDNATQTCAVQPGIKRVVVDEDGNEAVESLPQIVGVPVGFYTGGGFMMTLPVAAGDTGLLIFSELPIDTWLDTGKEADPGDLRHHGLGDAFFLPCVRPTGKKLADASADTMAFGKSGGPQIHIAASTIALGSKAAADWVALASKVDARIAAIESAMSTWSTALIAHPHTCAAPGSPSSPPVGLVLTAPSGSSTASTKVKAE